MAGVEDLPSGIIGHVEIKALPDAVTADPDRLARFEREGKALARLNAPNVAGGSARGR
jgi:hypothetical protein